MKEKATILKLFICCTIGYLLLYILWFSYLELTSINILTTYNSNTKCIPIDTYKENYSDSASNCSYKKVKNSLIFQYQKSEKINHAFCAVYIPISCLNINYSNFDKVIIKIKTKKAKRIPIQLSLRYKNNVDRYLTNFLDIKKGVTEYTLKINDFHTPPEWFETNNLSFNELPSNNLRDIQTLSFESCHLLPKGVKDEYTIQSIVFCKKIWFETFLIIISGLIYTLILFNYFFKPFKKTEKIIHIPIHPLNYNENEELINKIARFLSLNYSNPDLQLIDIQKELGISGFEISKELKKNFDLSFPNYLNKLRIEEAKRIFSTQKFESISEIAYKVGYNSPNNFNRVFKNFEKISPKEFLQSIDIK